MSSPIKCTISASNSKFPFSEHLQIFDDPPSDIYITLIGKGDLKGSISRLNEILHACDNLSTRRLKSKLHNLAKIAEMSETLAKLKLKDDREYRRLKKILPLGLDFQSILTLSKIIGD